MPIHTSALWRSKQLGTKTDLGVAPTWQAISVSGLLKNILFPACNHSLEKKEGIAMDWGKLLELCGKPFQIISFLHICFLCTLSSRVHVGIMLTVF